VLQLITMTVAMFVLPIIYCLDVSSSPLAKSKPINNSISQIKRWREIALRAEELLFCSHARTALVYFLPLLAVALSFLPLLPISSLHELFLYLIIIFGIPSVFGLGCSFNREINRSWEEEYVAKKAANQEEKS